MTKAGIARQFRKLYPQKPTLALARLMYKKHPEAFKDIEDARGRLRYIEGKLGENSRSIKSNKEFHVKEARPLNPYILPESDSKERKVFKLPLLCNKIGFISDLQVPFHDNNAIKAACEWLKDKGVNTIFINGDLADFYSISNFLRDVRKRKFKDEIEACKQVLQWIRGEFPLCTIYYNLDANHERRFERYMIQKAPELLDVDNFRIEDIFELSKFTIKPIRDYDHVMIGKLPVVHGDTVFRGFGSPVSKARTVWLKTKHSCIASHVHQTDEFNTKDIHGKLFTTWTTGCLMSLNVEYNPHGNEYNHGFAYIETDQKGNYRVENKRILDGVVL